MFSVESLGGSEALFVIMERFNKKHLIPKYPKHENAYLEIVNAIYHSYIKNDKKSLLITFKDDFNFKYIFIDKDISPDFLRHFPEKNLRIMIYLYGAGVISLTKHLIRNGIDHLYAAEFAWYRRMQINNEIEKAHLEARIFEYLKDLLEKEGNLDRWFQLDTDPMKPEDRVNMLATFELPQSLARLPKPKPKAAPTEYRIKRSLLALMAPDNRKAIRISEGFINGEYDQTHGLLLWTDGGGGLFDFRGQGKSISAQWLDNQTLEITHDPSVVFGEKDESFFFMGEVIQVKYRE